MIESPEREDRDKFEPIDYIIQYIQKNNIEVPLNTAEYVLETEIISTGQIHTEILILNPN